MYDALKTFIQGIVKANGNEEITGTNMQEVLLQMVDIIGSAQFRGIANPLTDPGTPVHPAIYITAVAGTYVNFANIQVTQGELALLKWDGMNWIKETIHSYVSDIFVRNSRSAAFVEELVKVKGTQETLVTILKKVNGVIIGGLVVWSGTGLTFYVTLVVYIANNLSFTIPFGQFTLDAADPAFDRIDVVAVNDQGAMEIIKGDPAATPIKPQITFHQIELTYLIVKAGSATPDLTQLIIYNENIESTGAATNITADFDNLEHPQVGLKAVKATNLLDGGKLTFTLAAPATFADYSTLSMFFRLLHALNGKITAQFFNGAQSVSDEQSIILDTMLLDEYQLTAIALDQFRLTGEEFDTLQIRYTGIQYQGFYLDYIKMEGGIVNPSVEGWYWDVKTDNGVVRQLIRYGDNTFIQPKAGSRIKLIRTSHYTNGNVMEIDFDETGMLAGQIDDLNFDFRDIENKAMTYVLVLKAAFDFEIISLWAVCDAATSIDGVTVKINGVAVTGISNATITTTPQELTATNNLTVAEGDTITLTATGITGTPTELVGTIKRRRV